MSRLSRRMMGVASLLAGAALAGCNYTTAYTTGPYQAELDLLRASTHAYADGNAAANAGYSRRIMGCMADSVLGGMGLHVGNNALINATVELERPEVLLYEPKPDGVRELVAVEYIVPIPEWTDPVPPTLMGQTFKRNEALGVYALHVWLYKDNPAGIFADWNPRVSCAAAIPADGAPAAMQH